MICEVSGEFSSLRNPDPCPGPAIRATQSFPATTGAVDPPPHREHDRVWYAGISPTRGIYSGRWYIGVASYWVATGTPASTNASRRRPLDPLAG